MRQLLWSLRTESDGNHGRLQYYYTTPAQSSYDRDGLGVTAGVQTPKIERCPEIARVSGKRLSGQSYGQLSSQERSAVDKCRNFSPWKILHSQTGSGSSTGARGKHHISC